MRTGRAAIGLAERADGARPQRGWRGVLRHRAHALAPGTRAVRRPPRRPSTWCSKRSHPATTAAAGELPPAAARHGRRLRACGHLCVGAGAFAPGPPGVVRVALAARTARAAAIQMRAMAPAATVLMRRARARRRAAVLGQDRRRDQLDGEQNGEGEDDIPTSGNDRWGERVTGNDDRQCLRVPGTTSIATGKMSAGTSRRSVRAECP